MCAGGREDWRAAEGFGYIIKWGDSYVPAALDACRALDGIGTKKSISRRFDRSPAYNTQREQIQ